MAAIQRDFAPMAPLRSGADALDACTACTTTAGEKLAVGAAEVDL